MVGKDIAISLLEVNAYPDFKQTGDELAGIIQGLLDETTRIAVVPFLGGRIEETEGDMVKVLDIGLGSW